MTSECTPAVGDVWRARKATTYTSAYEHKWGRGRLVEVTGIEGEVVGYQYITGNRAGSPFTMTLARFRYTYEKAGRIDE